MAGTECRVCGSVRTDSRKARVAPFVAERMLMGNNVSTANECLSCGLLWCGANPSSEDLSKHYEDYWGRSYLAHRMKFEPNVIIKHWHLLYPRGTSGNVEEFVGFVPNSVLDIGGGRGHETPFKRLAETVHILDVAHGDPADGTSYVDDARDEGYDLVVLAHVLEHVPNPVAMLRDAARACNHLIYIEVPNEASQYGPRPRLDRVMAVRGEWHEHLNYYDPCSISRLVSRCDLDLLELRDATGDIGPHLQVLAAPR